MKLINIHLFIISPRHRRQECSLRWTCLFTLVLGRSGESPLCWVFYFGQAWSVLISKSKLESLVVAVVAGWAIRIYGQIWRIIHLIINIVVGTISVEILIDVIYLHVLEFSLGLISNIEFRMSMMSSNSGSSTFFAFGFIYFNLFIQQWILTRAPILHIGKCFQTAAIF